MPLDRNAAEALALIDNAGCAWLLGGGANTAYWRGLMGDALDRFDACVASKAVYLADLSPNQIALVDAARGVCAGPLPGALSAREAERGLVVVLMRIRAARIDLALDRLDLKETAA